MQTLACFGFYFSELQSIKDLGTKKKKGKEELYAFY